jgi:hypothetical protein
LEDTIMMNNAAARRSWVESWTHSPQTEVSREQAKHARREQLIRASYQTLMTVLAVACLVALKVTVSY